MNLFRMEWPSAAEERAIAAVAEDVTASAELNRLLHARVSELEDVQQGAAAAAIARAEAHESEAKRLTDALAEATTRLRALEANHETASELSMLRSRLASGCRFERRPGALAVTRDAGVAVEPASKAEVARIRPVRPYRIADMVESPLVDGEGRVTPLLLADFRIETSARWTSPTTGTTYPASWSLKVPSQRIDLQLTPLVADCELHTGGSTGIVYWEGPVRIEGSATGYGYAELTGYSGSMSGRF